MYDVKAACKRQEEYCATHNVPFFAPKSGVCWHCRRNIYIPRAEGDTPAYSVARAGTTHITGCPFCCRSYCD